MKVRIFLILILTLFLAESNFSQKLPKNLKKYLDRNFSGWKLAGKCYEKENTRILVGDFDGNKKSDYAIKFVRGEKGFMMAFLGTGGRYRPFYLHIYSADQANFSDLILFKKGESYEPAGTPVFRFDAPADFGCESDIGGIHAYRNGKFIAY